MTSSFFQAVYPFFPFTYGISAMREAIFRLLRIAVRRRPGDARAILRAVHGVRHPSCRPLMRTSTAWWPARCARAASFNRGGTWRSPARPYRVSQLFRALSDKEEYREELRARMERFEHGTRVSSAVRWLGAFGARALAVVFSLTPAEKVQLLTAWLVWLVVVFVFLVVVESLRAGLERR